MAHVRSVKESGNALWGARRVRSAARKYRKCLRFLEHLMAHVRSVKESGNALWGARRVRSAARKYRKCLRFLEHVRDRLRAAKKPRDSCEYCTVLYCIS
ncbi:unnamed protein product [Euphydryas editha]|nr:unnamed protein product [Euphydryas editha]CAH2088269.1 unnamed protein product [Euphydryas editha]CAH2088271.1 unnamed protein product [Euphydryas editha]